MEEIQKKPLLIGSYPVSTMSSLSVRSITLLFCLATLTQAQVDRATLSGTISTPQNIGVNVRTAAGVVSASLYAVQ